MDFRDLFIFSLPVILIFFLRRKKSNPFFLYIVAGLLAEASGLPWKANPQNHLYYMIWVLFTNLYVVFECTTYYSYLLSRQSKFHKIYKFGFIVSITTTVFIISYFDPFLNSLWPYAITSVLLMFMGLLGYYEILFTPEVTNPLQSSFFWINSAFFFYGASSTIIFLFIDSGLREEFKMMANLWILGFGVVNALRYIFISIGVYQKDMIN